MRAASIQRPAEELLPCPFCGSRDLIPKKAYVQCAECCGEGGYASDFGETPENMWNRRVASAPNVNWLANVIRTVDGRHTLGAGALAEAIVEAMKETAK